MKTKWTIISIAVIVAAGLLPFFVWFNGNEIISGADYTVALDPSLYFQRLFYAWLPNINGGAEMVGHGPATAFYQGILALGFAVTGSLLLAQKSMLCIWMMLPGISMLFLAQYLVKRYKWPDVFIFFAVLIYLFNLYHTIQFQDAAHLATYTVLPLLILLIFKGLWERHNLFLNAFLIGLLSIVGSIAGINPPMLLVLLAIVVLLVIGYFVYRRPRGPVIKSNLKFLGLAIVITLLISSYWIIPFVYNYGAQIASEGSLGTQNLVDWLGGVSRETSLLNNSRMIGAWDWYSGYGNDSYIPYATNYFSNPFLLISSLFLPILAFGALLLKKNKFVLFSLVIAVIGILFASGTHAPFGAFYEWAAENIPLFWLFRSPWYKFSLMISFGYAIAASFTLAWIYTSAKKAISRTLVKNLTVVAIVVIAALFIIGYNYPLITGEKYPRKGDYETLIPFRVHIPDYVEDTTDYINQSDSTYRIGNLPPLSAFNYEWNFSGITDSTFYLFNSDNLYREDVVGTIANGNTAGGTYNIFVTELINEQPDSNPGELLKILATDQILQKNDMLWDFYGELYSPELMKDRLGKIETLVLKKQFGKWDIYEYSETRSRIYATGALTLVEGDISSLGRLSRLRKFAENEMFVFDDEKPEVPVNVYLQDEKIDCQSTNCEVTGWQKENKKLQLANMDNTLTIPFTVTNVESTLYLGMSAIPEEVALEITIDDKIALNETLDLTGKGTMDILIPLEGVKEGEHILQLKARYLRHKTKYNLEFAYLHLISETQLAHKIATKIPQLEFSRVSPVEYQVAIENANDPFLLIFQENYDLGWKAYVDNKQIPSDRHLSVNGYANAWQIDKTGDYKINLYYWPQELIKYGGWITIFTLAGGLIVSLIFLIRKKAKDD